MLVGFQRSPLQQLATTHGDVLHPPAPNQVLVQVREPDRLLDLAARLQEDNFYLVSALANDERELEDRCFKIYYLFSHPSEDRFLMVEYLLNPGEVFYPSIHPHFTAVDVFEREMCDLFGLIPAGERAKAVEPGAWLHAPYPPDLYPLRRNQTTAAIKRRVEAYNREDVRRHTPVDEMSPGPGSLFLPVGPVHAGVIEPGRFVFKIAGEVVDDLMIYLGYTHKGIERLFQARMALKDGWQLAEQVSGDATFAHSLAYCQAAEALAGVEAPQPAQLLRGLLLELERIYNHVGDVAALAHDVALDVLASELAVVREKLLRLNADIAGHRFLRGLNRPGGIVLPRPLNTEHIGSTLRSCLGEYRTLAWALAGMDGFRDRAIGTGILTTEDAVRIGATGLVARASGVDRDYRRDHPSGIYRQPWLQRRLEEASLSHLDTGFASEARNGDVYARFLTRVLEVETAADIVYEILDHWTRHRERENTEFLNGVQFDPANNFTFATGYVEGWRGDIVYWLMQDKLRRIYRCKVRDPSMLNWPALRESIIPHNVKGERIETILPDFPFINKSFNLSYSGNDL